jgi:Fe-S oxidoreductase
VQVLYFSGCFAGYIRPAIGTALIQTLTRLGMTVHTPPQHCCGLPLLTKGRSDAAREKIRRNLERWLPLLDRVDHIVVTCSSCGLALMDEWSVLMDGPRIRRVADKVIHASRLIRRYLNADRTAACRATLAYHQPCHLKVQTDPQSTMAMLGDLPGINLNALDSHCCGMAGTWGLAAKNDGLSRTIGAHLMGLIDAVGANAAVTDCPTCEMQMAQLGTRPVLHPVEIVARCLRPV